MIEATPAREARRPGALDYHTLEGCLILSDVYHLALWEPAENSTMAVECTGPIEVCSSYRNQHKSDKDERRVAV